MTIEVNAEWFGIVNKMLWKQYFSVDVRRFGRNSYGHSFVSATAGLAMTYKDVSAMHFVAYIEKMFGYGLLSRDESKEIWLKIGKHTPANLHVYRI